MAKYGVDYTCGHRGTVELLGKCSVRYERIAYMERTQVCPDCYREARDAQRAAQSQTAAKQNTGMVDLIGTPKQVAWAETIRVEKLANAARIIDRATNLISEGDPDKRDAAKVAIEITNEWTTQASASWWIDHRNTELEAAIRNRYAKLQSVLA